MFSPTVPVLILHLDIYYRYSTCASGINNVVPDTLSRIKSIETIDYKRLAEAQNSDDELQGILKSNTSALKINFPHLEFQLYCDVSAGDICIRSYVSASLCQSVFNALDGLSRPGIKAT